MRVNLGSKTLPTFLRCICFASATVLIFYAVRWMPRLTHGFVMYYTYSRTVLEGGNFSGLYDFDRFNLKMKSYGIDNVIDMPNNMPTTAIAAVPVAWLPPVQAKVVWTILLLVSYGLSLSLLMKVYDIDWNTSLGLSLLTIAFLFRPTYENIAFGQLYIILLLCFSLSLLGMRRKSALQIGIPISVTLLLKGYGIPTILGFAVMRQWKQVLYVSGLVAFIMVFTLPWLGFEAWRVFVTTIVPSLGMLPSNAHVTYQTINSLIFHLFTFDTKWLPFPLVQLPSSIVRVVSYVLNGCIVLAVLYRCRRASPSIAFAAILAASVVTAPLAEEHHYVLFLPLMIAVSGVAYRRFILLQTIGPIDVVFLASILVLAVPLPYKSLQFAHPPLNLLAYPKLYAGLSVLTCFFLMVPPSESETSN